MLRKILFLVLLFFFFFPKTVSASAEFSTDALVTYKVRDDGITNVTHKITVTNLFSNLYVTSYTLKLDNTDIKNPKATDFSGKVSLSSEKVGETTSVKVSFDNAVVGKGKARTFEISFDEEGLATHTGGVWEVSIPRLGSEETFNLYSAILSVPTSFGKEAYLSPKAIESFLDNGNNVYKFDKDSIKKTGVVAAFGDFQVFDFTLNYHLENPLTKEAAVDVAIPPDTSFQKLYYRSLSPQPENVVIDPDGNWVATYKLKARERKDVSAIGSVQIFASSRAFLTPSNETLAKNLQESSYWQTKDPQILSLAKKLSTPRAIYDYVSQTLKYDIKRVKPNVERLGAKRALENPTNAICMEYTDLFVALARAAGIPAREVNGYAYTENPDVQPISLVADVLHAWPEYWDSQKSSWIPVDPTWASTTGGVDYFTKLDLRHFTFVNHGQDPTHPYPPGSYKLGPNPQKDVFVSFGELPKKTSIGLVIQARLMNWFPFFSHKIKVTVENPGPSAFYNLDQVILFDGKEKDRSKIISLLPFAKYTTETDIPFSILPTRLPETVEVLVGNERVAVPTGRGKFIVYNLLILFFFFCVIIGLVILKVRKYETK